MKCKDICMEIESEFPLHLKEDYDNVGLLIGRYEGEVKNILVALEVTENVVNEAINKKVDMIVAHHPLIFKKINKITDNDYIQNIVLKLIENKIALYASHTNFDIADRGMNHALANKLELENIEHLLETKCEELYKIAVYVPKAYEEEVADAMLDEGAGHIGNYSHCSFRLEGMGTFKPLEDASPFIGSENKLEKVEETKIETVVRKSSIKKVINKMLKTHPYEEVAYDIYKLENNISHGIGKLGTLKNEMSFIDFCNLIKKKFSLDNIIVSGDMNKSIKKVAIIGGSGGDLLHTALNKKCDCIITGDIKHHLALDISNMGLNIIDITHFDSEKIFKNIMSEFLSNRLNIEIISSESDENPLKII